MPAKPGIIPNMGDVTNATRVQLAQIGGAARPARRRKKAATSKRKRAPAKRTRSTGTRRRKTTGAKRRTSRRPAHMVKGSAAAKRHMAKLRRMRRKR